MPPPAWLPRVGDGYAAPYRARTTLTVKDRRLILPSGGACLAGERSCEDALSSLDTPLALEVDARLTMADLSGPLAALSLAIPGDAQACLAVVDAGGARRCVPFHPFSGDEFAAWLDADAPVGKIRVVMRSDGLEVVTDRGKIPGPDRYGPSLPPLEGRPDFAGLDAAVAKLHGRFPDETIAGLVPSGVVSVGQVARALSILCGPDAGRFDRTFLVYP